MELEQYSLERSSSPRSDVQMGCLIGRFNLSPRERVPPTFPPPPPAA